MFIHADEPPIALPVNKKRMMGCVEAGGWRPPAPIFNRWYVLYS